MEQKIFNLRATEELCSFWKQRPCGAVQRSNSRFKFMNDIIFLSCMAWPFAHILFVVGHIWTVHIDCTDTEMNRSKTTPRTGSGAARRYQGKWLRFAQMHFGHYHIPFDFHQCFFLRPAFQAPKCQTAFSRRPTGDERLALSIAMMMPGIACTLN